MFQIQTSDGTDIDDAQVFNMLGPEEKVFVVAKETEQR